MKTDKVNLTGLLPYEVCERLTGMVDKPYRGRQILSWLYEKRANSFLEMSDLPEKLRERLKEEFILRSIKLLEAKESPLDGTSKYLFGLLDGESIETVLIPEEQRMTVCVSTQVGCVVRCFFCASGGADFVRNLKTSEIVEQILSIPLKPADPRRVTHVVFMGIGEPFLNYDNLIKAVRIINSPSCLGIAARRITISTCGVVPGIEKFAKEGLQVKLSVSLHSADDEIRKQIIPLGKKYRISEIISGCKSYIEETGRLITFEYVLIKNLNDRPQDASLLANLLKGISCKVNLIPMNPVANSHYTPTSPQGVQKFSDVLRHRNIRVTLRRQRGGDILASCGQLRAQRGPS